VIILPKGVTPKPTYVKAGETPRNGEKVSDELSNPDKGHDFVKAGETAQIGH
jgi:hypothetical protein